MNSSGQGILEYLIVLVVILMTWQIIAKTLHNSGFFATVFGQPWARIENVIEFGVPADQRKTASPSHPTSWARHSTKTLGSGG